MASQPTATSKAATTKTNAAAASPSTTKTNTTAATTPTAAPQGHPPYADMIKAALVALNERNGSSRKAIAKYIESNYSHFSDKHDALIAVMLKKMKESGKLVMVKKSYKLPAASSRSIPVASGDVSKKKMGRPFKNKEAQVDNSGDVPAQIVVPFATEGTPTENRKSGRPHSKTKTTEAGQSSGAANGGGSTLFVSLGPEVTPARKQPVGKPKSVSATKSNKEGTQKRMGRPPKNGPDAEVPGSAGPGSVNIPSKRRGRRPGASPAGAQARASPLTTPVRSPTTAGVKRRGRRPGTANKPATPVARPEKNGGAAEADAGESSAAYTSLKRKFEYLQARVKETVSAVKPRLRKEGEEEATIGRQLTDLEELATVLSP